VEINPENLAKLTFLKQCMDESLRLFSPVPHNVRKVAFGELDLGLENILEKDTQIHLLIHLAHTNKNVWGEDAREFKPERFLPENAEKRHPYAFSPFGHVRITFTKAKIKLIF
jgi:cytochrome P450